MDIILVFGGVTATDYQHLRTRMLRSNESPKVIRVRTFAEEADLFSRYEYDAWMTMSNKEYKEGLEARIEQLLRPLLHGDSLDDVKAIILPEEALDAHLTTLPRTEPWGWLIGRLPEGIARYRVRSSARGGANWLESIGENTTYGHSLPLEKANIR